MSVSTISVIGLGKLGGTMAAAFAHRGYTVIGVDINPRSVEAFNNGLAPVYEPGLSDLIKSNRPRLKATLSTEEAILNSDITFVIVPTPSVESGAFTLQYAKHAFAEIGSALGKKNGYHVVVMTSTVLPGSMTASLIPILQEKSGRKCGEDFGVCYNPEFIALGSVINDFLNPDFYLLGEFDKRSGDLLESVHKNVSKNNAPVKRMSIENAELSKIAVNSFVTMKISFANLLAELCNKIPGGDVGVVSDALGMDSRIGRKYLNGGLGFAGPCFPRDNRALAFVGNYLDVDTSLLSANDSYNDGLVARIAADLIERLSPNSTISILGLSYKPNSHIIESSSGVAFARIFAEAGFRVKAHDTLAIEESRPVIGQKVLLCESVDDAIHGSDALLVTTQDEAYESLTVEKLVSVNKDCLLVDFWRNLGHLKGSAGINYLPYGIADPNDQELPEKLAALWC
jgi:UDPglucose 6-dehydrogenase